MKFSMILAAATALLLAACNPGAQMEDAREQIGKFQALYNAGDSAGFYREGGATLRKVAPAEQLEGMIALVSARLGKIKSSKQTGFNTAINNGNTTTTIVMQTLYERGEGTETYVFQGSGEDMELAGWNVNSPLLNLSPEDVKKLTEDKGKPAR
jgi:hypothetical protein